MHALVRPTWSGIHVSPHQPQRSRGEVIPSLRRLYSFADQIPISRRRSLHRIHELTVPQGDVPAPEVLGVNTGCKKRLAIFVSGEGSNFKAIHKQIMNKTFEADVAVCLSDRRGCPAWQYAEAFDIPTVLWPGNSTEQEYRAPAGLKAAKRSSADQLLYDLEHVYRVDFVILAGFRKLVPHVVVQRYHRAMLNIHPSLLPAFGGRGFYGGHVHKAVVASRERFTGPTVHFVDENFDTGPILAQRVVSVQPHDTPANVAAKVQQQEHEMYPEAVAALVEGRIIWRVDGVPVSIPRKTVQNTSE